MSIPMIEPAVKPGQREPNMLVFAAVVAGPLVLAFVILMILIFNDGFQHAGIDAKSITVLWLVGAAFAAMLLGAGIWSLVYRTWMGFLLPLGVLALGALLIPPLQWLAFQGVRLLVG